MPSRLPHRHPASWQATLGGALDAGARIYQVCTARRCGQTIHFDVAALVAEFGRGHSLWDARPPCARCGAPTHYMGSSSGSGSGSMFVPLLSGRPTPEGRRAQHRELLDRLGLSAGDWARVKALAEAVAIEAPSPPAVLDDLAQPLRIAAVPRDQAWLYGGTPIGTWAGQQILMWRMGARERAAWNEERHRRWAEGEACGGPGPAPSPARSPSG